MKNGWLDRRGKFYPCGFNQHACFSVKLEKKLGLKHSIEYLGWIKVHDAGVWFFEADSYCGRQYVKVTAAQKKWLLDNGFQVREYLNEMGAERLLEEQVREHLK